MRPTERPSDCAVLVVRPSDGVIGSKCSIGPIASTRRRYYSDFYSDYYAKYGRADASQGICLVSAEEDAPTPGTEPRSKRVPR